MEHMEIRQLLNWLWKREPGEEDPIVVEDSAEPILTEIKKPELVPDVAPVSKFIENKEKELAVTRLAAEKTARLEEERIAKLELEKLEAEKSLKEKLETEKLLIKKTVVSVPIIEELPVVEVIGPEIQEFVAVEPPKVIIPKNRNFSSGMTCTRNLR